MIPDDSFSFADSCTHTSSRHARCSRVPRIVSSFKSSSSVEEGWKTLLQHSSESSVFAHRRTHQTGFKGVSHYAYGCASKARVVVAYREIEYRGTFYLERVVTASSSCSRLLLLFLFVHLRGFYCSSRVT